MSNIPDYRYWKATLSRRALIKLGLAAAVAPRSLLAAGDTWSFAVFSDTHFGVPTHEQKNRLLLEEIAARGPELAFLSGDLTERAWPHEFDEVDRAFAGLPFPLHVAPGNHEVRWAPRGLQMFTERVGLSRQLLLHRGCAFLLLDSTVPLSHWGHIGGPQRAWLQQQLSRIDRDTPLFVFFHHPVGRPSGIDDDLQLAQVLAPYNTKVVFTGHGHADLLWDWHGITATMGKGLYQGTYQWATIDEAAGVVRLQRRTETEREPVLFATVSLAPNARPVPVAGPIANHDWRPLWQRPLGGGVMSQLLLHRGSLYVSAMDGVLYAFAAKQGKPLWQARTEGYCFSSPVVAGDRILLGSADGNVYAFDRGSGREIWRASTNGPVYGSAAIARGVAAIASGDGTMYGIDMRDGKIRWRYALEPGPSAFSQSPAATDGRRIYFGAWDQNVYALDAATGREVWRYRATERGFYFSAAIAKPALANGRVHIPANENVLHCIDARTGTNIWKQSAIGDKFGYSSPTIVKGRIYIGTLGDKGEVRCLAADSGKQIWSTATGAAIYESSPAVSNDIVSIGSVNGTLSMLRADTGALLAQHRLPPGLFVSSPAAGDGQVYAATFAELVAAFDLAVRPT